MGCVLAFVFFPGGVGVGTQSAPAAVATPESIQRTADGFNKYPDRFLFGGDCVAPTRATAQTDVYRIWKPIRDHVTPEAKAKICKLHCERIFDKARKDVRAWEKANVTLPRPLPKWSPIAGTGEASHRD
ncbi:MAG: hypothetical protein HXY24_12630 [Rubrivivax sp.]|nr:hypothetical protein [Rubrivivax sp.]